MTVLRLAPGVDWLSVDDAVLVRGGRGTVRIEGRLGEIVRDRILPALADGALRQSVADELPEETVDRLIARLVRAGLVIEDGPGDRPATWTHLVTRSLDNRRAVAARAERTRVVLVGLAAHQVSLAETLAAAGVGAIVLADDGSRSVPPAERLREGLSSRWPATRFETPAEGLTARTAPVVVAGSSLVVVSVHPTLSPVHHWLNRATLRGDVPSLHAAVDGVRAELGPLVLPGAPPCYLCWRMRALACADDFEAAMAWEEHFDDPRTAGATAGPVVPHLSHWVAGLLAHEVLAVTLGVWTPRLTATVATLDALRLRERTHHVLPRPDCPDCGAQTPPDRGPPPPLGDLLAETGDGSPIDEIATAVVSPVCGIVRTLAPAPRRPDDPGRPFLVRARLANTLFEPAPHVVCGGRGVDPDAAVAGALAESLECHAALTWSPARRVHLTRRELDGPSLDPRDLVLHAPDQYPELPFAPYDEATALDWVPARSLSTGDQVWVPLLAAHLGFQPPDAEYLFQPTSSGFAAGSTLAQAVLAAALEVIERDAFLLAWLHRWPGERTAAADVPDPPTRSVAAAYARRRVRIDVHRLPTDTVPVVLAAAWGDGPPRVVVGLGADLDPVVAARRAVHEVAQVRTSLRVSLSRPATQARQAHLAAHPGQVRQAHDHPLLYADPATAEAGLSHLTAVPLAPWVDEPRPAANRGEHLREVVARLVRAAGDLLYLDVTPADVARLGVHVARVIAPGFQPLHFGAGEARLGGARLYAAPGLLGAAATAAGRLNLAPHPLG